MQRAGLALAGSIAERDVLVYLALIASGVSRQG